MHERGLPQLGVLARRDYGKGITSRNRVVAFARIVGTITGDASDILIRRDLPQQVGQHRRVTDVAAGHLYGPYFQRFLVDPPSRRNYVSPAGQ